MTLVGWSDAAYVDRSTLGKWYLGYVFGLMSSPLKGPRYSSLGVPSSLGGEVYAFSGMVAHKSMLREFYAHFLGLSPGMAGLENCES